MKEHSVGGIILFLNLYICNTRDVFTMYKQKQKMTSKVRECVVSREKSELTDTANLGGTRLFTLKICNECLRDNYICRQLRDGSWLTSKLVCIF